MKKAEVIANIGQEVTRTRGRGKDRRAMQRVRIEGYGYRMNHRGEFLMDDTSKAVLVQLLHPHTGEPIISSYDNTYRQELVQLNDLDARLFKEMRAVEDEMWMRVAKEEHEKQEQMRAAEDRLTEIRDAIGCGGVVDASPYLGGVGEEAFYLYFNLEGAEELLAKLIAKETS